MTNFGRSDPFPAEDIVQTAFVKVGERFHQFDERLRWRTDEMAFEILALPFLTEKPENSATDRFAPIGTGFSKESVKIRAKRFVAKKHG